MSSAKDDPAAPIAMPVLDYAPLALAPRWGRTIRVLLWIDIGLSVIATIACVFEVETIVATGPCLLILGFLLIAFGRRGRQNYAVVAGAELIGIVVMVFALINLLDWSPRKAQVPVSWIACLQVAVASALAARALYRSRVEVPLALER